MGLTPEEMDTYRDIMAKEDQANHLYNQSASKFTQVDDSFKFKSKLLKINDQMEGLLTEEILIANLGEKDKKKSLAFLSLALDLKEAGLNGASSLFFKETILICGISRGYKGFQQDKFNEQRDIRVSKVDDPRSNRRGFMQRGK